MEREIDESLELEHILFTERKCRSCRKVKNLLDDFYLTHKDRGPFPSAYSYECKECTIDRIKKSRVNKITTYEWGYPDW
mgnify:CR=1 FL=1